MGEERGHNVVGGEGEEDGEENDSILRQALALSLAEHNSGIAVGNSEGNDQKETEQDVVQGQEPMQPLHSELSPESQESDSESLPDFPPPPSHYPYWSSGKT